MLNCPQCQTVIASDQKFCSQCGELIEARCPACDHPTPPSYKFCGHCGQDLGRGSPLTPGRLSPDEKLRKIKRYLPDGLSEKILAQKGKIEGERKLVTVMFCDMAGFTPISERIGPENVYTVMDQVYEILINKVHELEGTVNEMTGDGIMALFGAPIAYEDAPQRAIRASLGIHREIVGFSERMQRDLRDVPPIRMRIGIHTGPVVVVPWETICGWSSRPWAIRSTWPHGWKAWPSRVPPSSPLPPMRSPRVSSASRPWRLAASRA
jgi:hypothetical protein